MPCIDRPAFFKAVRQNPFGGHLSQGQVDGMSAKLDVWERHYAGRISIPQLAYCLATSYHETAATMQPIKERGGTAYFTRMYDIRGARPKKARELGNIHPGDGALFCGRSDVQLTGRANYRKATQKLRAMGILRPDEDLEKTPDLVMRPDISAAVLFSGMDEGWFTGRTLDKAIDDKIDGDEHRDFVDGRPIINGRDRAEAIAQHADGFLLGLKAAYRPDQASPSPTQPRPLLAAASEAPKPVSGGFFSRLHAALSRKG